MLLMQFLLNVAMCHDVSAEMSINIIYWGIHCFFTYNLHINNTHIK